MNVNVMMQYVTYGLALIGVLAFLVLYFRIDYCGVCSVFGCDRRLGKSKRYLGQDEIQRFRGRVIPL